MELTDYFLEKDYFRKLKDRSQRNYEIACFYYNMDHEHEEPYQHRSYENPFGVEELIEGFRKDAAWGTYTRKGSAILSCAQYWRSNYYRLFSIKDVQSVNLCHDRFCLNCQSYMADKRQFKYEPLLNVLRKDHVVCHCILTVPNPVAEELLPTVQRMFEKFAYFVRFFKSSSDRAKVKDMDFLQYGYEGALRSFECTYNDDDRTFHPHFHCMFIFRKDCQRRIFKNKRNVNQFSFKNGQFDRYFTDFEILFQKLWYLVYNGIKVTKQAIEDLPQGYSCFVEDAKGHYHEVFKYSLKGSFDDVRGGFIYDEEIFRVLYRTMLNLRVLSTYGILRGMIDEDADIMDSEVERYYNDYIAELERFDKPVISDDSLDDILRTRNVKYMSKLAVRRMIYAKKREEEKNEK